MASIRTLCLLGLLAAGPAWADPAEELRPMDALVAELDAALEAEWKEAGVKPAKDAEDVEFLRRVSLDLTGVIPDEPTVAGFLSEKGRDRRARLVDTLLFSKDHANFMAHRWANLLAGRTFVMGRGREMGPSPLLRWLQQQFAANTHWDVVAQQVISAKGEVARNGAAEYVVRWEGKAEELAGNAMRVFQGQQVQCAQCHDHPYKEAWKQEDFWGVAAFFARAQPQRDQMVATVVERSQGEVHMPMADGSRGPQIDPRFITGESIDPGEGDYRRDELARIITSKNNPWFARAAVVRTWSFFFGQSFTDPDDMAKPEFEPVVELLEQDFKASGYDMRRLMKAIVLSAAYQRTSTGPAKGRWEQVEVFARAPMRPLTAEQMWFSFERAIGLRAAIGQWAMGQEDPTEMAEQRLYQLRRGFFTVFGTTDHGANPDQSLTQALSLLNGYLTNASLRANANPLIKELLALSPQDRVTRLFVRILGRPANKGELRALTAGGQSSSAEIAHLQDIMWALLNSSEFSYNH